MKLLIYMRDGRTVYRITGRANLAKLLQRDATDEDRSLLVARGIWNPATGEYVWTPAVRLRYIAKGSISVIEEDTYGAEAA